MIPLGEHTNDARKKKILFENASRNSTRQPNQFSSTVADCFFEDIINKEIVYFKMKPRFT